MRSSRQLELPFLSRGGARKGAGRKPAGVKAGVSHARRPGIQATASAARHDEDPARASESQTESTCFARAFGISRSKTSPRSAARAVFDSKQPSSSHCRSGGEARAFARDARARGAPGSSLEHTNRAARRVFADRYHSRPLRTPLEVRRALLYVLQNHRHHTRAARVAQLDPLSSSPYFDGFSEGESAHRSRDNPTAEPSTWLLRIGWRRHGLLGRHETPA